MRLGADRHLEVGHSGVPIRVDSAVWRHSRITFGPQVAQDTSLGYPARPQQQPTRFEHHVAARSCSIGHDSKPPPASNSQLCAATQPASIRREKARGPRPGRWFAALESAFGPVR